MQQYYQVLQQQPDYVHQFYTDASSIVRVDGDSSESASALVVRFSLLLSFFFCLVGILDFNYVSRSNFVMYNNYKKLAKSIPTR